MGVANKNDFKRCGKQVSGYFFSGTDTNKNKQSFLRMATVKHLTYANSEALDSLGNDRNVCE